MELTTQPFTPLAVGETDWRAFDITKDCDGETPSNPRIVSTWLGGPGAGDDNPQAIVGTPQIVQSLTMITGAANTEVTKTGQFISVLLGPPPAGAASGRYLVQALFDTPTRSDLSLAVRQPCSAV
jgi:hypothetical protein